MGFELLLFYLHKLGVAFSVCICKSSTQRQPLFSQCTQAGNRYNRKSLKYSNYTKHIHRNERLPSSFLSVSSSICSSTHISLGSAWFPGGSLLFNLVIILGGLGPSPSRLVINMAVIRWRRASASPCTFFYCNKNCKVHGPSLFIKRVHT